MFTEETYTEIEMEKAKQHAKEPCGVLGVSIDASHQEIKEAYKKLALQYHPDKNQDLKARQKFLEIQNAYEQLTDSKL